MKIQTLKSDVQISATLIKYCNLKTFKMGKTWHFIFATVETLKQTFLLVNFSFHHVFNIYYAYNHSFA
jgi:hypothetical protein